jgi:hypothetical protein
MEPHRTPWNLVEGHRILWNIIEHYGNLWKALEDYISKPYMDMELHGHDILKCKTINFPHPQF